MIYFLIFFILLLLSSSILFVKDSCYISSFFILSALIFFTMFRSGTGTDFYEYSLVWTTFSNSSSISQLYYYFGNIEIGYKALAYVAGFISKELYWFLFVNALLSLGFCFLGLCRIKKTVTINLLFSLFVYFCSFLIAYNFNAMRQAIVMGLFLFSIKDIISCNKRNVLFISAIAISLHSSGIFILISYMVRMIRYNRLHLAIGFVVIGVAFHTLKLSNVVFSIIGFDKFNYFSDMWGGAAYLAITFRLAIFLFLISLLKNEKNDSPIMLIFLIYSVGLMFYFILLDAGMLASRVNMFFRVLEIILFPFVIRKNTKQKKILLFIVISLFCLVQLYMATLSPDNIYIYNKNII